MFLIYINDVVEAIADSSIKIRLYADDCVLYTSVSNPTDQQKLNKAFSLFCDWSRKWQATIIFKKTVSDDFYK